MTALFTIMGRGIEVYQFNPYNATDRARLYEVDGSYFVDLDYITNLPEGIPDALQQQTTQVMLFAPLTLSVRFAFVLAHSPPPLTSPTHLPHSPPPLTSPTHLPHSLWAITFTPCFHTGTLTSPRIFHEFNPL
jgi:hypothetical protein